MIFPPFFGQQVKVILTEWNTMVMLRWCQPEEDTQVVLGLSAVHRRRNYSDLIVVRDSVSSLPNN